MIAGASYRGQPLVAFLAIVGGWVVIRLLVWDAGLAGARVVTSADRAAPVEVMAPAAGLAVPASLIVPRSSDAFAEAADHQAGALQDRAAWAFPSGRHRPQRGAVDGRSLVRSTVSTSPIAHGFADRSIPRSARQATQYLSQPNVPQPLGTASQDRPRDARWSADGWVLARSGGAALLPGGLAPPAYGASQMGAVLRYRLATRSAHRPTLYLRGSAALNGSREREVAFGASARPLAGLPFVFAAEARGNVQPGRTRFRPAAMAYTELPPVNLPLRTRAEVYAQAGYVGGNFASAFADGQLRLDRSVAAIGRGELRAGGGAWGGAQKGAARLDLGPSATLAMPVGDAASARLAVDWRFRVAGNAAPTSGPAVTLSAGF